MSAPSNRRIKDPPAASGDGPKTAAHQKPVKAIIPSSISGQKPNQALQKSSSGKENPRLGLRSSGCAQKPVIRAVPRIDKAMVNAGGDVNQPPARWSTSSAPRGRSASPSDFIRVFSDSKRDRGSRVNANQIGKGIKGTGNATSVVGDQKENCEVSYTSCKSSKGYVGLTKESEKKVSLSSDTHQSSGFKGSSLKGSSDSKAENISEEKSMSVQRMETTGKGGESGSKRTFSDSIVKASEISKGKRISEDAVGCQAADKHHSKLHEKLAFLEGKVKRIASDIKKTKEILDMNNPDASKLILSDIQEKISGIEKAMCYVAPDSDSKSRGTDGGEIKILNKSETLGNVKITVKGLKVEELEARLFPHHKLLRNRTSLNPSSGGSTSHEAASVAVLGRESKVDESSFSSGEQNIITQEFLISLDKDHPKVSVEADVENCEVQEMEMELVSGEEDSLKSSHAKPDVDPVLTTDEILDEFDDQENKQDVIITEDTEDTSVHQLNEIGCKTSTGGWFVSDGEAVLLAHDDGSCSYYDVANCEEKAVYHPPAGISPNIWRDCWVIRAAGADGCAAKYVVAASAGNTLDSGFCSWDFYNKDVRAFHIEDGSTVAPRAVLALLPNRRNTLSGAMQAETRQWWYKPCGPLLISTATSQRVVKVFDIRDSEQVMTWELQKPVITMDYSSPVQWRNKKKVVIAESETISVWDVSSQHPEALQSISSSGRKISAMHINNTDAELGGGVRQRVSSSEAEGNDGVFCTADSINILDIRHPSGIGAKIPKAGLNVQSVYSRGDSILIGCSTSRSTTKKQLSSQVQQFSLRKQRLLNNYSLPESNAHSYYSAITQVWGNSNLVMGICGLGLFAFDAVNDERLTGDCSSIQKVKETIGPDDLYSPSFDYISSRLLLISSDRPAMWKNFS